MARTSLPPGFRFHPTDVELVMYYLKRKIMGKRLHHFETIAEVNIYRFSPWDLPDKSCLKSKDLEWFFFCPREKKYACGLRMKRGTENGFWKTTGKDRKVHHNNNVVGLVRTLVFHLGHAPKGERTDWVIHEYRIVDEKLAAAGIQDMYVLCKVFKKAGPGPKNGAQYGAPFNEAEYESDDDIVDDMQNHGKSLPADGPSSSAVTLPENQGGSVITGMVNPGSTHMASLPEAGPSHFSFPPVREAPVDLSDDEIDGLLARFVDDDALLFNDNGNYEMQDVLNNKGKNKCSPCVGTNDIYNGLHDLDNLWSMNEATVDFTGMQKEDGYPLNYMFPLDDSTFLELNDLEVPLNHAVQVNEMERMQFDPFGQRDIYGRLFSGVDHYSPCLVQPPQGFNQQNLLQGESSNCNQDYNAAGNFTSNHTEDRPNPVWNAERGCFDDN